MDRIRGLLKGLDEAVFPSNIYCLVCGAMIDQSRPYSLCDDCIKKMHWINERLQDDGNLQRICVKCGKVLPPTYHGELCYDCISREHFFERGFSCLTYGLHERELMMDLKYNGKSHIAVKMGEIMFDRMKKEILSDRFSADVVCAVPVSASRMRTRGYNQAELMAKTFVKCWREAFAEAPSYNGNILVRCKNTQMLRGLNPAERVLAMQDAFAVRSAEVSKIKAQNILLIDDIYTTGATADACSKVLLENGAAKVFLLTLASGGNRKPRT